MTKTAKHFPRIARDVGREHFLADGNRGGHDDDEDKGKDKDRDEGDD